MQLGSVCSHLALCVTSLYGMGQAGPAYSDIAFGVMALNSVFGVIYYVLDDSEGSTLRDIYVTTRFPLYALSISPITSEEVFAGGHGDISIAPTIAGVVPFVCYLANDEENDKLQDTIITVNAIILGVQAYINKAGFGILAAVTNFIAYATAKSGKEVLGIPPDDTYNYFLCIFVILAIERTKGTKLGILEM